MSTDFNPLRASLGTHKVLTDSPAITAYAIDASIYKVVPQAISIIESSDDLEKTLLFSRTNKIPLTARSGGTNLTGNAVGKGIILEFSRLNQILEINERERWVRVQPGIVYAELNRRLARKNWMFAPDPSSGDMCKLGGMLGNNAAGPHTLKYGATKENVLEMEVLLANGNWIKAKEYKLKDPALESLFRQNPFSKEILELIQKNKPLIQSRQRSVSKNSSGYTLFSLADGLDRGVFPLHQIFIGSEGTLGLTMEAKVRIVPKPTEIATALIYMKSLSEIGNVVNELRHLSPSALEMMDANSLDLVGRQRFNIPENAVVMLLTEFDDDTKLKIRQTQSLLEKFELCAPMVTAFDPEHQAALWRVRKAMYPTLYRYDTKKKPINFADDVVVPTERIPELIDYLETLFLEKGVSVAIYGHIGDGNAHINPLLNLNDPADFKAMVDLSREIHQTVIERFGGSLCGEHGDGRVRAEFLKDLYGPEIYALFKKVKNLFDPEQLLNPGVKITEAPFTEQIDLKRMAKQCATCGKCNVVCPVYDVAGEESNAARGWFHILTDEDYTYEESARVVEACINCKSCRSVCPAGIDVSELILQKREVHPNKIAETIFSVQDNRHLFEKGLKLAAWTQPIWDNRLGRMLIEKLTRPWLRNLAPTARIPAEMTLPRLAKKTLREHYPELNASKSKIAYFHGCAANYLDDGVGDAVIKLLKTYGIEVALPEQKCSGTPIETYGLSDRVREVARFNLDSLARFDTVITGCASCTFMLKDYAKLFNKNSEHALDTEYNLKATQLVAKVSHISEFVLKNVQSRKISRLDPRKKAKPVTYHSSCHLRAAGAGDAPKKLLRRDPSINFLEMADSDRCAGGAGTFCIKNPDQSAKIFARKKRGIEESGAETVVTSCPACMIQLKNGMRGKVKVEHIAQTLLQKTSSNQESPQQ
ncbi:MAG: FAD-binding and (Fe-S)-binding domain-containing protein [Nitrospiria bacterium]